ncbi:thioredoxin family protein [Paracrocinitomix mangrovi]|uniref:thioredoxin family protein n=1 Tax=Paracrocinitomix mangrovi TaxID=2862509 RepID=UPI001C8D2E15|nr:thioredoxin family protein [Paracrocinitomix mangrovi]UKN02423.1 thioredoxin family protein [Paracrocinitomix mangrovi]
MKSVLIYSLIIGSFLLQSCGASKEATETVVTENIDVSEVKPENIDTNAIVWMDFESAIDANEKNKKPIFIDVYTSWCGWCVKMDNSTFKDKDVVKYMNEKFYSVKMDAESKDPIAFKEVLYEYKMYNEKTGYNELAVNLLGSSMSFPSFVILSKKQVKVGVIKGYQQPSQLLAALKKYE